MKKIGKWDFIFHDAFLYYLDVLCNCSNMVLDQRNTKEDHESEENYGKF